MSQYFKNELLEYKTDSDGIGWMIINQVNEPANLFSFEFVKTFVSLGLQAIADPGVKGVIVTSGQKLFMAGGDLRFLGSVSGDSQAFFEGIMEMHKGLRAIETGGKPFVAAINGTALGGGLELCLACHYRIALNDPGLKLGFPEINVGLFPGGGGTSKAPYLLGIQNALFYLLQGLEVRIDKALKDGLIHAVANSREEMEESARNYILSGQFDAIQPWDNKKYKIPGGGMNTPAGFQVMMAATGNVRKITHGNYPAAGMILRTIHDGMELPIDRALEVEARYFTQACQTKEARNMIRTGFFGIQAAKKGKARPLAQPNYKVNKLGVIGAGMMGAGIAYVSAKAGIQVILQDINRTLAENGKEYSRKLLNKAISDGKSSEEKAQKILACITPSDDISLFLGCDLVIETVTENPEIKYAVTQSAEAVLANDKIMSSNTSTIPITLLAEASERPENFIGIHFFSPVDKMPLVEIIKGKKTEERAIAAAVDYTVSIGKVPIVVNDSRGFFTSRCFGTFCSEGLFLLEEGVPAVMIENIAKMKGMPVGPLAVMDEVTLSLMQHVYESNPEPNKPEEAVRQYNIVKLLIEKYGRESKKSGKGFYDYPVGEKKKLWPELNVIFNANPEKIEKEIIAKRIMHRQALESYRCLDEGVLSSVTDGDIGSVLGWGFPLYTGGAISYIDFVGIQTFVSECDTFAKQYGSRFEVPSSLRELAAEGKSVFDFGM